VLCGRLLIRREELTVEPISIVDPAGVHSLGLISASKSRARAQVDEASDDEPELFDESGRELAFGSPLGRALAKSWDELEAMASGGAGARQSQSSLGEARAQVSSLGLSRVATALSAVEAARTEVSVLPKALLEAAWTVRLAESLLVIERAVAELG
jgi:hypothetical protein